MLELQELLDEWLISCWLNRPHDGLRDPQHPGRAFTPNEKYAALVEAAGYVPVALGPDDYIELLPAQWRAVNAYGIKLNRRSYDSDELNPLRLQPSGVREKKNLWEIRHDPYDVSRIFVRGRDGWITVFWKHLDRVPVPFGELAWNHVRRQLVAEGRSRHRGTDRRRGRGAAAPRPRRPRRSGGTTEDGQPRPPGRRPHHGDRTPGRADRPRRPTPPGGTAGAEQAPAATAAADSAPEDGNTPLAKVIPLGIFDPFAEAEKRW